MSVTPQQTLPVVIRCGQGIVCKGRVINVSTKGMLVEFPKGQVPPVQVGCSSISQASLSWRQYLVARSGPASHGLQGGILFFVADRSTQAEHTKHPLTVVLHSLSRAVASA